MISAEMLLVLRDVVLVSEGVRDEGRVGSTYTGSSSAKSYGRSGSLKVVVEWQQMANLAAALLRSCFNKGLASIVRRWRREGGRERRAAIFF